MDNIDILLATFNAEQYIEAWIDSISVPDGVGLRLLVRDDRSTDNTIPLIQSGCARNRLPVEFIEDGLGRLGAVKNFEQLLHHSSADYVMLADQDDIWLPHKIPASFHFLKNLEEYNPDKGILIFTDMYVADESGMPLTNSYWLYERLQPRYVVQFKNLLTQNVAAGCTMMMNRRLVEKALPIPQQAMMHDWWLMLVAGSQGVLSYLEMPTLLYRQHGGNLVGAAEWSYRRFLRNIKMNLVGMRKNLHATQAQANAFVEQYRQSLSPSQLRIAQDFAHLSEESFFKKRQWMLKNRIAKTNFTRTLGMYCLI